MLKVLNNDKLFNLRLTKYTFLTNLFFADGITKNTTKNKAKAPATVAVMYICCKTSFQIVANNLFNYFI